MQQPPRLYLPNVVRVFAPFVCITMLLSCCTRISPINKQSVPLILWPVEAFSMPFSPFKLCQLINSPCFPVCTKPPCNMDFAKLTDHNTNVRCVLQGVCCCYLSVCTMPSHQLHASMQAFLVARHVSAMVPRMLSPADYEQEAV